ncbi:MAG: type IV secretory system conjugative DNA transfer family protein [Elusimicrobia bacterium]|nr:type IV secretory system conjugative DNA transfer family protein [Elusimicrobiota bacterium]
MNEARIVMVAAGVSVGGGLFLVQTGRRKLAGLVLGLCLGLSLPFIAWPSLMGLRRAGAFKRVHLAVLWRDLFKGSLPLGAVVGLAVAFGKTGPGRRKPQWNAPRSAGSTDGRLGRILAKGPDKQGTLLGAANGGLKVFVGADERERHMQVVGPTRAGKSQLLLALAGQDMQRDMPVFMMEGKGDSSDFDQFLKLAELAGRSRNVRYFNPQDPRSMTFNPIRRLPGQDTTAVANQLARAIGREPTSSGEGQDYYRSLDYSRMLNMVEVFCATGLEFTFKDCLAYFSSEAARKKAFDLCKDRRTVDAAADDFKKGTDCAALTSAIRPWTTGELGRLLNDYTPHIRLEEVFQYDELAYFAVPVGHLQVLANPLGRMIISGLLSVASSRQRASRKPGPASVILDEFAEFATPVFASFIATVGSARFWTVLSHQDLGQLKRIEGMAPEAFHSAVFANTSGCKVCFRTPAPEDAEFWAATLGTYTTFKDTEQIQRGLLGVSMKTGNVSRREVEEFKVHPNLLKSLVPGTALVYSAGRLECLARTAGVARLLDAKETPELELPFVRPLRGLELESEVKAGGRFGKDGRLV